MSRGSFIICRGIVPQPASSPAARSRMRIAASKAAQSSDHGGTNEPTRSRCSGTGNEASLLGIRQ